MTSPIFYPAPLSKREGVPGRQCQHNAARNGVDMAAKLSLNQMVAYIDEHVKKGYSVRWAVQHLREQHDVEARVAGAVANAYLTSTAIMSRDGSNDASRGDAVVGPAGGSCE